MTDNFATTLNIADDWLTGVIHGEQDRIVAMDRGQVLRREQLLARIHYWCACIQQHDSGSLWGLYNPDAFEFAAQLVALWLSGKTACLPGDNLPETRAALLERVSAVLGDWEGAVTDSANWQGVLSLSLPAADALVVEVYTSGSTGAPKAIGKKLRQLTAELQAHAQHWPYQPDEVVLSTVSHQHIYGLLFRILRPLAEGVPFERRLCHYLEDLYITSQCYGQSTLISSPSHLERLPQTPEWQKLWRRWQRVFSSAAPLSRQTSLRNQTFFGMPIVEIYGSSETGGIAWRIQRPEQEACWTPLAGVTLRSDQNQLLELRSPHLPDTGWYTQPDRIEWQGEGSGFLLLGRTDRIAKIEGKRLSLTAMEQALNSLSEVEKAHALVLSGRRDEVAVVLQLSRWGQQQRQALGQHELLRGLKAALARQFEAVVLPRRWRIVEVLPWNSQGKLTQQALQALFAHTATARPALPLTIQCDVTGNEACLQLQIPDELLYFDGHFDQAPILPGVVQVHWAQHFAKECFAEQFGTLGAFVGLERVKFQQLLRPSMALELLLQLEPDKGYLTFQYRTATVQFSSGRFRYVVE